MPPSEPSSASQLFSEANLAPPRPRAGLIARPRLFAVLDRLDGAELTLVSAPAGSGKTVVVSSWLQQRPDLSTAWVTVERRDDDSIRLWTAVSMAVDRLRPGIARPALAVLRTPRSEIDTAIDELLNGLAGYAGRVVIVLDDLHHVTDDEFLRSLGYAVERLPQTTRLVATTRSDPRIQLGRFRARGALGEVRAADLALTADEARELMAAHGVGQLAPVDVELLVERTEGWTAGVVLAGMWLSGNEAPRENVRQFSASHVHVADYLTTEVLDILAPEVRSFLLRTSVLSRFTASLCDAVLETTDAAEQLGAIARSNLFLVPLDARGEWFRYHHLFCELLRAELASTDATAATQLRLRAASWFAQEGLIEDALEHAHASGEFTVLAQMLEDHCRELIRTGRSDTLLRWLERLPPEEIARRPLLAAVGALTSGLLAQPATVRRRYAAIAESSSSALPEPQRLYVETVVALTRGGVLDRDLEASLADARRAAELAVVYAPDLALPTLAVLSYTEYLAGNDALAQVAADAALARPEVAARPSGVVYAHAMHGLLELDRGRHQVAQDAAVESVALAEELGLAGTWSAGIAHHVFGEVLLAQGRPREAERELDRAVTLRQASEPRLDALHSLVCLARARVAGGRLALAESDLALAREQLTAFTDAGRLRGMMAEVEAGLEAVRRQTPHVYEAPSEAELSILRLLESDLSQREIGEELFLSLNTVKTHSRRLYAKLGAHSRQEAIQKGHALGLIDSRPASPLG